MENNDQKLIDLCFDIALTLSTPSTDRGEKPYDLTKLPIETKAEWIANRLRQGGFNTVPMGMSWGVLCKT